MITLYRLTGTRNIFEFYYSGPGEPPGALTYRRAWVEKLTGEPFPLDGTCPVTTMDRSGDPEWEWLGLIEEKWSRHPLEGFVAMTMSLGDELDKRQEEIRQRTAAKRLKDKAGK